VKKYIIAAVAIAAVVLIGLAIYMLNKQSFSGAVGVKPPPVAASESTEDGDSPTGG
jgi:LPS O-antigen subunit length determinant protein (WzzB/FepE family)